ncbi:KATNB1-like protein 1 isoform X2 [Rhinichthys klamathensis goyatoka]|uniref:KATNB1-like protein 1 isoform X2 n=1 Tax=Rhinichthys klamathensis goyatoka TaxID=3034132 RepID=UPI0024B5702A|nr:KATNB1-like protein 1 isoform X2 [Rhinichthys klamathensis goyatoka]
MATGSHVGSHAEVHRLKQAQPHDLLKRMVCSGDEKNMREVDYSLKDETDQERFPVGRCVHKYSKAKRALVSKKKTRQSGVGSRVCRRLPTASRTSDMANKENELTCPDDVQAILYSDNCGFPVNSTDSSKMTGAGSKYSDYFTELSKDHEAMTHVLFGRNLRLNVALTLWRKNASELVAYLNRIQDTGVLVDCLPVLTKSFSLYSLQEEQPCISIGCCVDLLPQVNMILNAKYEEHLIVALHWVQSIIKNWWSELSTNTRDGCSNDRNVQAMKTMLLELWEGKSHLSSVPGTVGETAKVIESYLSQLR